MPELSFLSETGHIDNREWISVIELVPTKEKWPRKGEYLCTTQTVHARCGGRCGKLFTLCDHTIDAEGFVNPSVVCPTGDCGWHVFLRLMNWPENDILEKS